MSRAPEWLYDLLPAFIRSSDVDQGEPLRALMSVLEMEYQAIESDLDLLYENWFVETCEEWVLPYLGDLLGLRGLTGASPEVFSLRGRVGNAIAQRRRKGTLLGLAGAVRDGTGWAPHVVRYRNRVARSGSIATGDERQPPGARNIDLRRLTADSQSSAAVTTALDGPFRGAAHTVAISGMPPDEAAAREGRSPRRGRLSPLALGIYLWRLQLYPVSRGGARRLPSPGTRFTVSPFGIDQPLFWLRPVAADASDDESGSGVPEALGLEAFATLLDRQARDRAAWRDSLIGHGFAGAAGSTRSAGSAGSAGSDANDGIDDGEAGGDDGGSGEVPLRVHVSPGAGLPFVELPSAAMIAADLERWVFPPHAGARLAVDPQRGRLLFAEPNPVRDVRVSFGYGASADLGGGGYPHHAARVEAGTVRWEGVVSRDAPAEALPAKDEFALASEESVRLYRSVQDALAAWLAAVVTEPGSHAPLDARVRILDSAIYDIGALPLALPPGCRRLVIEAGAGACPCLVGDLALRAMAGADDERPEVILSGLWIDGRVLCGGALRLRIEHCTLKPPAGGSVARPPSVSALEDVEVDHLEVAILSSIVGPIDLPQEIRGIAIADSIVDCGGAGGRPDGSAGGSPALRASAAVCARTTVFGAVSVGQLWAASCLFTGRVEAADPSEGGVRFSYLPPGSSTGQRESCQPQPGAAEAVKPSFTSTRYGDPGYAQLTLTTPAEISAGGEDGCEMGAYHDLYQPQRRGNLPTVLEEFVPWGCEAFVEFVT